MHDIHYPSVKCYDDSANKVTEMVDSHLLLYIENTSFSDVFLYLLYLLHLKNQTKLALDFFSFYFDSYE